MIQLPNKIRNRRLHDLAEGNIRNDQLRKSMPWFADKIRNRRLHAHDLQNVRGYSKKFHTVLWTELETRNQCMRSSRRVPRLDSVMVGSPAAELFTGELGHKYDLGNKNGPETCIELTKCALFCL